MKITIRRKSNRVRSVVIFFSMFMALMLFQTSYMRLGTITASVTLLLTIAAYFVRGSGINSRLLLPGAAICLVLFLMHSVLITMIKGMQPSGFVRYIGQIVMCLVLFSVTITDWEHEYLQKVFVTSASVYAIMIIWSLYQNAQEGYIHTHVRIFNTEFDPNFIGIPMVAATALLLDNILRNKKRIASALMYMIVAIAIVYTASRGSFLSFAASNMLVLVCFLFKKSISSWKKLFYLVLPVIVAVILFQIFKTQFPAEWARITAADTNEGSGRLALWRTAIQDWEQAPIFGNGLGYAYAAHAYVTHNTYLQVLSETGLVGLALAMAFAVSMLRKAASTNIALFCALVGVMIQIMFLDALDNRCLWILLSWIAMLPTASNGERLIL